MLEELHRSVHVNKIFVKLIISNVLQQLKNWTLKSDKQYLEAHDHSTNKIPSELYLTHVLFKFSRLHN